jgi:SAM-dependent methyltransferase
MSFHADTSPVLAVRSARRSLRAIGRRARRLLTVLREDGFVESIVLVRGYVEYRREKRFGAQLDRKYGCETGGRIPLERLAIDSPNVAEGVQYEPVSEFYFRRMLGAVSIPPDTYAFVDLGSGKGRALLIAAEYPFKRFVGIEFSPELHDIARRNIARVRARTGSRQTFQLHLGDVANFEFPLEPLALHLYNPFGEPVLRQVLERLSASLREVSRDVLVFYRTPVHQQLFNDAPFLRRVKATSQYAVYASLTAR